MVACVCFGVVHSILSFYVDKIAKFYRNSFPVFFVQFTSLCQYPSILMLFLVFTCLPLAKKMLPRDFVTWNQKLCAVRSVCTREKKKIYTCINTCFLQTNFDLLPEIFAVHVCKTICASFASFFNMASFPRFGACVCVLLSVYTFRFAWAPAEEEQEMEFFWHKPLGNPHWKMNVFNTWSIFGVCGIRFKNRKYIYVEQRTNTKKNYFGIQCSAISEKLCCWIFFEIVRFFLALSSPSFPSLSLSCSSSSSPSLLYGCNGMGNAKIRYVKNMCAFACDIETARTTEWNELDDSTSNSLVHIYGKFFATTLIFFQ